MTAKAAKGGADPARRRPKPKTSAGDDAKPDAAGASTSEPSSLSLEFGSVWHALPAPCVVFDPANRFVEANAAAEQFFQRSATSLARHRLPDFAAEGSRLYELIDQARTKSTSLSAYGVEFGWFGREQSLVDLQAAHIFDAPGHVVLMIQPRSIADAMDRSMAARGSARSLSGLSSMLAHEIKNPLAGISGAAQLLEMTLGDGESELMGLIHEEVERIKLLVERMDMFSEDGAPRREPVNIHDVLDQARRAAAAGYARHVRFREQYDPSLPSVPGDRSQLLQAVSNLIKNAAEAAPSQGGEITLKTAFRPGVMLSVAGGGRARLPLEVSVIDNGPGVPDALRPHLFEPFVTSKSSGTGLGLALVAKVVDAHGGVVECAPAGERTAFRMLLPIWVDADVEGDDAATKSDRGEAQR